jgi:hypothetical protein
MTSHDALDVPAGAAMLATVTRDDLTWTAWISPHEDPTYVYVNVMSGSIVDGTKRPIRRDYAHLVLDMVRFPGPAEWVIMPNAKRWTYNELLFPSRDH